MTKKEKELLLKKDLSARIPFGVDVEINNKFVEGGRVAIRLCEVNCGSLSYLINNLDAKPILRPMSSMTEEERNEFENLFPRYSISEDRGSVYHSCRGDLNLDIIDWLNEKEFDYRGLIDIDVAYSKKTYRYA
jgi:hypothetical protein